jgi:hypothetical protein
VKHLAAIALMLLAGCSTPDESDRDVDPGVGATAATPAAPQDGTTGGADERRTPARVGVLVGARLREVREALTGQGLRLEVTSRVRCGAGVVLAQDPAPGTEVDRGATIGLVVARAPTTATCTFPYAATALRRLEAWAREDEPAPELADRVRFLVASRPVRTLTAARAGDPAAWTLDVAYAERPDVRILDLLSSGPMADRDVPPFSCPVKSVALPADLVRRLPSSWSLVTRRPRACMEEAAVQVWTDGAGRITDVNVLLGSP